VARARAEQAPAGGRAAGLGAGQTVKAAQTGSFIACRPARDANCACGATEADACKAAKLYMCDTYKSVQKSACQKPRRLQSCRQGAVAANSKQHEREAGSGHLKPSGAVATTRGPPHRTRPGDRYHPGNLAWSA
jgi:hypothetical protein